MFLIYNNWKFWPNFKLQYNWNNFLYCKTEFINMVDQQVFKGVSWQSIHLEKMKYHELLFNKRESAMWGINKIIITLVHQIYLEYWNSHRFPTKYLPNFATAFTKTYQECEYIKLYLFSDSLNSMPTAQIWTILKIWRS